MADASGGLRGARRSRGPRVQGGSRPDAGGGRGPHPSQGGFGELQRYLGSARGAQEHALHPSPHLRLGRGRGRGGRGRGRHDDRPRRRGPRAPRPILSRVPGLHRRGGVLLPSVQDLGVPERAPRRGPRRAGQGAGGAGGPQARQPLVRGGGQPPPGAGDRVANAHDPGPDSGGGPGHDLGRRGRPGDDGHPDLPRRRGRAHPRRVIGRQGRLLSGSRGRGGHRPLVPGRRGGGPADHRQARRGRGLRAHRPGHLARVGAGPPLGRHPGRLRGHHGV